MTASRSFPLSGKTSRAILRATADFAGLQVSLNGSRVLDLDPYDPPGQVEVTRWLTGGENVISVMASGVEGPSAFALTLEIAAEADESQLIRSDASWEEVGGRNVQSCGPVDAHRWALNRLPDVSPFAEYNQWKEALEKPDAANLSPLPPGFEIEKIRDAGEGEDSWVSLVFDKQGRVLIGKEQKGILRLTLSPDGNEVVAAETVEDTLGECRGLAWVGDTLYAHANNSKALYSLRDTNDDGSFDEVSLVQATEGGPGHGRNALAVHEGSLYAIVGDNIAVPESSPRRARPELGAPAELGHTIRIGFDEAGKVTWEAMNRGLRNPYGIAFNAEGEAFTYDADNEGDVGLPFYHPTRICHLVSGANYGWHQERGNTHSFPIYAPDSVPSPFEVGRGSPTAVKFGTRSAFPSPWKEALFALDWAYGRIVAVHLNPNGAGYLGSGGVFLEGRPLNVTDLDFDSHGAMWFVTGGRKTKSALFRVRYTGEAPAPVAPGKQAADRIAFSAKAREQRRSLERFHGTVDPGAVEAAWPHLASPDPWIRNAARVALEWQPVAGWRERALAAGADSGGLTAKLALARAGGDEDRVALSRQAASLVYAPATGRYGKLTLMRIHELAGMPQSPADHALVESQLASLVPDLAEPVHRERARLLAALGAPDAITYALERFAASENQLDRLHYLEVLAGAKAGWTEETSELFFTTLAHAKHFSYGDRFMAAFFQSLEEMALGRIAGVPERDRLTALLAAAPEDKEGEPKPRPFVKHWTIGDFPDLDSPSGGGSPPDPARGRELYIAALCAKCHVCGTTGRPVGPDLTTVASRFSHRDLIESILDPSAVVAEVHRNVVVTKTDGSTLQGRIVQNDFRQSTLTLATNPFAPAELHTLAKTEIRSWEESPVSPMPPALLDTLTKEEIGILMAFLTGGGR
jgi:putative heme-binding domain-containing protein